MRELGQIRTDRYLRTNRLHLLLSLSRRIHHDFERPERHHLCRVRHHDWNRSDDGRAHERRQDYVVRRLLSLPLSERKPKDANLLYTHAAK